MSQLLEKIGQILSGDGWVYLKSIEQGAIQMSVVGKSGEWTFCVNALEEHRLVFFYSVAPIHVPADKRPKMAEYLMRVNRVVFLGHFVMDFDNGEIRFETVVRAEESRDLGAAVEAMMKTNIDEMDKFLPGILRALLSDVTSAEALAEIVTGCPIDKRYMYN